MEKRKEKKKWGLILFVVFIMIGTTFSVVFFGFQNENEVIRYNGIKFVKYPDRWEAKLGGRSAAFSFLPSEVNDIPAPESQIKKLQGKFEIDATYDSNSSYKESIALAYHQMGLTLAQYNIFVRSGFTKNSTYGLPIINCADSTENVPVIYFKQGNSTSIHINSESSCIVAESKTSIDFIRLKDRLLYEILGVMK